MCVCPVLIHQYHHVPEYSIHSISEYIPIFHILNIIWIQLQLNVSVAGRVSVKVSERTVNEKLGYNL